MGVHSNLVYALELFEKNNVKYLISGSYDKTMKVWNTDKDLNNPISSISSKVYIYAIASFEMNGELFVACGGGGIYNIEVWNVMKNKLEYTLKGHSNTIYSLLIFGSNKE